MQPSLSVNKENCFNVSTRSSIIATVGLKTQMNMSRFLLVKGMKQAMCVCVCFGACFRSIGSEKNCEEDIEEMQMVDKLTNKMDVSGDC